MSFKAFKKIQTKNPNKRLAVSDVEIAAPELLVPGRAPLGNVAIKPQTRPPRLAYLFRHNCRDSSGFNNHGTASAGNTYVVGDNKIVIDSRGPNNNDVITIPDIVDLRGGSYGSHTWIMRVKADTVTVRAGLFHRGVPQGNNGHYLFFEGTSSLRYAVVSYSGNYASITVDATEWNWIAATYNDTTDKINVFCNGVQGTEATNASPSGNTDNNVLLAAFYPDFNRQFDGQLAYTEFYDYAMTPGEVARRHADPYLNWIAQ